MCIRDRHTRACLKTRSQRRRGDLPHRAGTLTRHLHRERLDPHLVEFISVRDEFGDLLGRGEEEPAAVRALDHRVRERAERGSRPVPHDDADAASRTHPGDLAVEPLPCLLYTSRCV